MFFLLSMKEKSKNAGCMAGAGVVLHCFMFPHTNKHQCLELNFWSGHLYINTQKTQTVFARGSGPCKAKCGGVKSGVPRQGAASAQPLVLYVASENVLGSLEEHRECHTRDVALLWRGHFVAEGKLQQRLKTHLGKLLPHPHINLCLCREKTHLLFTLFCWCWSP